MKKLENTIQCWRLQRLLRFDAVREHSVPEATIRSLEGSQSDMYSSLENLRENEIVKAWVNSIRYKYRELADVGLNQLSVTSGGHLETRISGLLLRETRVVPQYRPDQSGPMFSPSHQPPADYP